MRRFKKSKRIKQTGSVDKTTFGALVAPMSEVLQKPVKKPKNFGVAMLTYAKSHLGEHPVEVGGPNRGPLVRLYMAATRAITGPGALPSSPSPQAGIEHSSAPRCPSPARSGATNSPARPRLRHLRSNAALHGVPISLIATSVMAANSTGEHVSK